MLYGTGFDKKLKAYINHLLKISFRMLSATNLLRVWYILLQLQTPDEGMPHAPTPVPLSELAPLPSQDELFGKLILFKGVNLWAGRHIDFGADPIASALALASAWHFLVCKISYKPVVLFLPNFHRYIIGT